MDDKILHLLVSLVLVLFIRVFTNPFIITNSMIYIFVLLIGLTKELIDLDRGGSVKESLMDMTANIIGIIVGMLIIK